jgi:uncharacterized membrane protein
VGDGPPGDNPYGAGPTDGGGYGAPPPTGGGGYGAPPPTDNPYYGQPGQPGGYQATEAVGYGWRKFTASPMTLLIPVIVVFVVVAVVAALLEILVYSTLLGTHSCTTTVFGQSVQAQCGPSFLLRLLVTAIITGLITIVWSFAAAGLYKGALAITDGQPFSMGQMFDGWDKGQVAIAAILIAVATAIGSFLCYIPGLIVGFLTMFTLLFIVDQHLGAVDAIKASIKLVTDNFAATLVWALLAALVWVAGLIVCCVGLLVAIPVILVGLAYTYRRLQLQPVVT